MKENEELNHEISSTEIEIEDKVDRNKLELYEEKLDQIKKRCDAAGIPFERRRNEDDGYARISIASGRDKRSFNISSLNSANRFLAIDFEQYIFIKGYDAICSYSKGTIEASIRPAAFVGSSLLTSTLLDKIRGEVSGMETDELSDIVIAPLESSRSSPTLRIGQPSNEFVALTRSGVRRLTLLLSGIQARQHDAAANELRNYANSLFFQIDLLYDSTFILDRERRRRVLRKNEALSEFPPSLEYPRQEYNDSAMSLYCYARGARGMPLLQFLAFYQSIEFFFPRFSQAELRKKLATILKNPIFRPDRDDDIDRVISAFRVSRSGGLGDERSQLRAVVNQCISAEAMRNFFEEDQDQVGHHSSPASKPRYHKIPLSNKTADLRNDVADRIYDIRCKIVHTKNDAREGDVEILLPFSEDAEYLMHDIDLVQFIAKSVLISASASIA